MGSQTLCTQSVWHGQGLSACRCLPNLPLCFQEVAQDGVQNTAVAIIIYLDRGINAASGLESNDRTVWLHGIDGYILTWL